MSQASLLGLTVELRRRIYDYLLVDASFRLPDEDIEHDRLPSSGKGVRNVWASLEICKTIRDEMEPLFFSETAFMIDDRPYDLDGWLETIGPEAIGQMRKVTLRCEGQCRK